METIKCDIAGTCKHGPSCTFAHGDEEIRRQTDSYLASGGMPRMSLPFH